MNNVAKILLTLAKEGRLTMRQAAAAAKIPYATFHRAVRSNDNLFLKERIGKAITIDPDWQNSLLPAYLAIGAEEEKNRYLERQQIIKSVSKAIKTDDIVLLFGSYAKETQGERSDIDLLIINEEGKKKLSFSAEELLFEKDINPIYLREEEFVEMLRNNDENLGTQALKRHILLNNAMRFWQLVWTTKRDSNSI